MRRVRDNVPWRLWAVALVGFWERAAFWGLTAPWQNYMERLPHHGPDEKPGALGLGQAKATRIYCSFYIFYYIAPIFIAPLADSRLGQYTTLLSSVVLYCLGILALTISSVPSNLDNGWGIPGLVVAMFLIGLGGGGVKAIMPPFIADQYTRVKPEVKTLKSGEQVVTDHELTVQYIYNLYFWIGNVGSLSWFVTVFIEDHYGFAEAYGLTLGLMCVAFLMLLLGKKWYVLVSHQDNLVIPKAAKIVGCAIKNGFRMRCADPEYQFEHRQERVAWSSDMVEELTRGLRGCRVLLAFVMFYVCFDQMQNNLISQAGSMRTNGTPNDLLPALNQVGCIVLGPAIQMGLYPFLHRRRIYIGPILRITIGFSFIALSMLYSTIVQYAIYNSPPCYDMPRSCSIMDAHGRPNVWLQAPVYFLISTGEIFAYVTGLEYAYDHSPKDMKVIVQAISLIIGGLGSAVALALTAVAHDPNLVIFYASLTVAMAATALVFWSVFRRYDSLNEPTSTTASIAEPRIDPEQGGLLRNAVPTEPTFPEVRLDADAAHGSEVHCHPFGIEVRTPQLQNGSETTLVSSTRERQRTV
ncbi:POT family-domain-containing protein [Paraphoma chrysanthemicola]|uniref:POT family-domain-containing protein n=1 Tax=Paraphoma chrysanthemicola TaxID=798071 RepID=A0A8K0VUU0_9PLEO|nr:POT family-domain-containing protein [Paraphoma chrysanthemicola]